MPRSGPGAADPPGDPELPPSIRALLPEWLTTPATSPSDLAIQAVVIERLHRLDPAATPAEVRREIQRALDRLAKRVLRYRRGEVAE